MEAAFDSPYGVSNPASGAAPYSFPQVQRHDFGVDPDVSETQADINFAEKKFGHKFRSEFDHDSIHDLRMPNLGSDSQMLVEQ